ncbi:MAG: hypothetical protein HEP71_06695 [Roseivirga sp.]|nr:hypothetical protein [Roseivirga sp.]
MYRVSEQQNACALCERERPLNFHHLIPKKVHKKSILLKQFSKEEMQTRGLLLCSDCHKTIHKHIDHTDLGRFYHSREALLDHPEVAKFVKWAARQDKRVK